MGVVRRSRGEYSGEIERLIAGKKATVECGRHKLMAVKVGLDRLCATEGMAEKKEMAEALFYQFALLERRADAWHSLALKELGVDEWKEPPVEDNGEVDIDRLIADVFGQSTLDAEKTCVIQSLRSAAILLINAMDSIVHGQDDAAKTYVKAAADIQSSLAGHGGV